MSDTNKAVVPPTDSASSSPPATSPNPQAGRATGAGGVQEAQRPKFSGSPDTSASSGARAQRTGCDPQRTLVVRLRPKSSAALPGAGATRVPQAGLTLWDANCEILP